MQDTLMIVYNGNFDEQMHTFTLAGNAPQAAFVVGGRCLLTTPITHEFHDTPMEITAVNGNMIQLRTA